MAKSRKALRMLAAAAIAAGVALSASIPGALAVTQPEADTPLKKENLQTLSAKSVKKLKNGVQFDLGDYEAFIRIYSEDLVKVSVLKDGQKEEETPAIAKKDWKLLSSALKTAKKNIPSKPAS